MQHVSNILAVLCAAGLCAGCASTSEHHTDRIPSRDYAASLKAAWQERQPVPQRAPVVRRAALTPPSLGVPAASYPSVRLANDVGDLRVNAQEEQPAGDAVVTNMPGMPGEVPLRAETTVAEPDGLGPDVIVQRSTRPLTRPYESPLDVGNPGIAASLWQEGRSGNELYRDDRAWLPGDLITILVSESSKGKGSADTDSSTDSSLTAAITSFFGLQKKAQEKHSDFNPESIIDASTKSEFKGEGETTREGSLKGTISAVVVEVLPTGVLRIEGEKIIAVNEEQEVMILSGLLRPRDVTSRNEVDSSKIANMRIDYYGRGSVGSAQHMGWFHRVFRAVWPF